MLDTRDLSHFVRPIDGGAARIDLAVDGITCAGCMAAIERGIAALPQVTRARVNLTNRRLAVEWNGSLDPARIIERLSDLGYRAYPFETSRAEDQERREAQFLLRCLAVAAFATMNIMLLSVSVWSGKIYNNTVEQRDFFHWLSALIAPCSPGISTWTCRSRSASCSRSACLWSRRSITRRTLISIPR